MNTRLVNFFSTAYKIPVEVLVDIYKTSTIEERNEKVLKLCIEKYLESNSIFNDNTFCALAVEQYFDGKLNAFADFLLSGYDLIDVMKLTANNVVIGATAKIRRAFDYYMLNYTDSFEDYKNNPDKFKLVYEHYYLQFLAKALKNNFKVVKLHSVKKDDK